MPTKKTDPELLKDILENLQHPERLDSHPWAGRAFVKDAIERHPELRRECPGRQLSAALGELFTMVMPSTPPRRGKRLDSHWGEFGILAAMYFAPLEFGAPLPNSLRDAWGRIDQAILWYVDNQESPVLSERQIETYRLVGQEPDVAPVSTLSDWHRKGLQKLVDAILVRERYLANLPVEQATEAPRKGSRGYKKGGLVFFLLALLVVLALGGYKAQRIYGRVVSFREDLSQLREITGSSPTMKGLKSMGPGINRSRQDFQLLRQEVDPFLFLGPWLGWVPVYGGELKASRDLLDMTGLLFETTQTAYADALPLLEALGHNPSPDPSALVALLNQAQPDLLQARQKLNRALQLRAGLDLHSFSPRTRALIEGDLDPLLPAMDDGLKVVTALPRMLGAASDGPKTYLLLAQNEDELRPTGGFITAAGTLVVQDGKVLHLSFVDSGELENWNYPYPAAPWQLEQYMNSPVLILRDANWSPDFPRSALTIESLYAYSSSHSVDGVIAFDQHLLVMVLDAMGPIQVEGASGTVDAGNVVEFMRASKAPPAGEPTPAGWTRKGFMDKIARALLVKMFAGENISWEKLGSVLYEGLAEEHLLLQFDDPALTSVIARRGWDGALRYQQGDFLMVVDANIGFNKTNAVVETGLTYDVDLTDLANPTGTLTVTHQNKATAGVPCIQWGLERQKGEEAYPIDACYWDYMRVYVPRGVKLLDATPQLVPADRMILNRGVNAPVDVLDEKLDGLQAFGTLMVVPGGQSSTASFRFGLPPQALVRVGDQVHYHLTVKKQPGTIATPILLRIHVPNNTALESSFPGALVEGNHLYVETNLRTDLELDLDLLPK